MSDPATPAWNAAPAGGGDGHARHAAQRRWRGRGIWFNLLLLLVLGAAIVYWVDVGGVWAAIAGVPPAVLLLGLLLASADRFAMGYKWRHLMIAVGARIRLRDAVSVYYQSAFSSRVLPLAIGNEVLRGYLARRMGVPMTVLVGSMTVEKLIALLANVLLALLGTLYLITRLEPGLRTPLLLALFAGALIAIGGLGAALYKPAHRWGGRVLRGRIPDRVYRLLAWVSGSLMLYRDKRTTLVRNLFLAIGEQLLQFTKFFVLGIGLGVTLPLMPFFATIAVVMFARRATGYFESWGLSEATSIVLFALLGIERETAVALALTNYALTTLATLPGAYLIYRGGLGLRQLKAPLETGTPP